MFKPLSQLVHHGSDLFRVGLAHALAFAGRLRNLRLLRRPALEPVTHTGNQHNAQRQANQQARGRTGTVDRRPELLVQENIEQSPL